MAGLRTVPPARLYQILQNTGLQQEDPPLYQFLYYLLGQVVQSSTDSGGGGGGGGSSTIVQQFITNIVGPLFGDDGGGGSGDMGPPGLPGVDGATGMVPYFIATGETFTVPIYKQALFEMNIDNEGTIVVDGFLIEVD